MLDKGQRGRRRKDKQWSGRGRLSNQPSPSWITRGTYSIRQRARRSIAQDKQRCRRAWKALDACRRAGWRCVWCWRGKLRGSQGWILRLWPSVKNDSFLWRWGEETDRSRLRQPLRPRGFSMRDAALVMVRQAALSSAPDTDPLTDSLWRDNAIATTTTMMMMMNLAQLPQNKIIHSG